MNLEESIPIQSRLFEEKQSKEMKKELDGCTFCKIVRGELKAYIVFNDQVSTAFLDIKPLFFGHCLLVTKNHYETMGDIPPEIIEPFFSNACRLSKSVQNAMRSDGTFVAVNNVVSQSVPHIHIHIVPRRYHDGLKGFFWPRTSYKSEEEAVKTQKALTETISRDFSSNTP